MSQSEPTLISSIFSGLYFQQKKFIPMAKDYQSEKSPIIGSQKSKKTTRKLLKMGHIQAYKVDQTFCNTLQIKNLSLSVWSTTSLSSQTSLSMQGSSRAQVSLSRWPGLTLELSWPHYRYIYTITISTQCLHCIFITSTLYLQHIYTISPLH